MKIFAKIITFIGILLLLASGYMIHNNFESVAEREQSIQAIDDYLASYSPAPFINSATTQAAPTEAATSEALYTYKASNTLTFLSHSEQWDESKLKELYEELLKNEHGAELDTLHKVVVWPQDEENAAATHTADVLDQSLAINFGALPKDFHLNFSRNISLIDLYSGDRDTTIESMAWNLSHEYGHLYTFHYMLGGSNTDLADTEYGKLRKSTEYNLNPAISPGDDYVDNHYQYLFEVAANDYVQLMGSPTTRQIIDFEDVQQTLDSGENPPEEIRFSGNNANPQENLEIPLASEVDGLAEYFYQFIEEKAPTPVAPKSEMTLSIESGSKGYDLVEGYRNFVHYKLTWNTPYEDALYTIVCYDSDPYKMRPIKTVHVGKEPTATIGTVAKNTGNYVRYFADEVDSGTKTFLVIAQLSDGTYYSSEPLVHTF